MGDPRHDALPSAERPERALLELRRMLGAYANLRPVRVEKVLGHSPFRPEAIEGADLLIVRELTGGIYYGEPRGIHGAGPTRFGVNTLRYEVREIERIARAAFRAAGRRRGRLLSVDKANVLETSVLWREVVTRVGRDWPGVALDHMYVDRAAMEIIRDPRGFDVILTGNMFGDILSDEASVLAGSLGLLPSASVGDGAGLYEPVHGSAPRHRRPGDRQPAGGDLLGGDDAGSLVRAPGRGGGRGRRGGGLSPGKRPPARPRRRGRDRRGHGRGLAAPRTDRLSPGARLRLESGSVRNPASSAKPAPLGKPASPGGQACARSFAAMNAGCSTWRSVASLRMRCSSSPASQPSAKATRNASSITVAFCSAVKPRSTRRVNS